MSDTQLDIQLIPIWLELNHAMWRATISSKYLEYIRFVMKLTRSSAFRQELNLKLTLETTLANWIFSFIVLIEN